MNGFDLFSGIGGFSLAMFRNGIIPVGHSEICPHVDKVYSKHFANKNYGDIKKLTSDQMPEFDVLTWGSPCQGLSISNHKREGLEDARSGLFYKAHQLYRLASRERHIWFVMENVGSMRNADRETITDILEVELLYIDSAVLTGQHRRRYYWTNIPIGDSRPQGPGDKFSDICIGAGNYNYFNENMMPLRADVKKKIEENRSFPFCLTETRTEEAKRIRRESRKEGKDYSPRRGKELMPRTDDKTNCITKTRGKEHIIWDGFGFRYLVSTELEELQGFPLRWTEGLSENKRFESLGNAVTVPVIDWILSHIPR